MSGTGNTYLVWPSRDLLHRSFSHHFFLRSTNIDQRSSTTCWAAVRTQEIQCAMSKTMTLFLSDHQFLSLEVTVQKSDEHNQTLQINVFNNNYSKYQDGNKPVAVPLMLYLQELLSYYSVRLELFSPRKHCVVLHFIWGSVNCLLFRRAFSDHLTLPKRVLLCLYQLPYLFVVLAPTIPIQGFYLLSLLPWSVRLLYFLYVPSNQDDAWCLVAIKKCSWYA